MTQTIRGPRGRRTGRNEAALRSLRYNESREVQPMIAPSISFDTDEVPPMSRHLTLEGAKDLIRDDVAELNHFLQLQAEDDAKRAVNPHRTRDYRLRVFIEAWERTQDAHWSLNQEILNIDPTATIG